MGVSADRDEMLNIVLYVAMSVLLVGGVVSEPVAMYRGQHAIRDWAKLSDIRITSITRRWFSLGPFQWRGSRWYRVFYVVASGKGGKQLEGYARVGGGYAGIIADEVDVRWS